MPFELTGPMYNGREAHTATLLHTGAVLVYGGLEVVLTGSFPPELNFLPTAELYNNGDFVLTGGTLCRRFLHTATLLNDGTVLVVGGVAGLDVQGHQPDPAITELYNPSTQQWSLTTNGLNKARHEHAATITSDGRALVVGGIGTSGIEATTEIFNPANQIWEFGSPLNQARYETTAMLLSDGRVLVVGGRGPSATETAGILDTSEISVPVGPWTSIRLGDPRVGHTATRLLDGRVVVAGGSGVSGNALRSSEIFDPASDTWYVLGNLNVPRSGHTAALLPTGKIMIVGGGGDNNAVLSSVELFDPTTGGWTLHPEMSLNIARVLHTQTVVSKRVVLEFDVLVTGGNIAPQTNAFDSAELYRQREVEV